MVPLGPLSLQDAVRLFCRLSPRLRTAKERKQCLEFLAPTSKVHHAGSQLSLTPDTTAASSSAQLRESALLMALSNGFPSGILEFSLAEVSLDEIISIADAHPLHAPLMPLAPAPPSQPPTIELLSPPHPGEAPTHLPSSAHPPHSGGSSGSGEAGGSAMVRATTDPSMPPQALASLMSSEPTQSQETAYEEASSHVTRGGGGSGMEVANSELSPPTMPHALSSHYDDDCGFGKVTTAGAPLVKRKTQALNESTTASGNTSTNSSSTSSSALEYFHRNHLLVLIAAPLIHRIDFKDSTIRKLDHEAEKNMLIDTFQKNESRICLDFSYATMERFQSLLTYGCYALHFSGHGYPDYLTFEDGAGGVNEMHHEKIYELVDAALGTSGISQQSDPSSSCPSLRFVFVSACQSHLSGLAFVKAGVPHVVCTKNGSELLDSAALCFEQAFYEALAAGRTVADSFAIGREAVASSPHIKNASFEADMFLLLPEAPHDGRHDVPVFGPGAGAMASRRKQLCPPSWAQRISITIQVSFRSRQKSSSPVRCVIVTLYTLLQIHQTM